jgi:hypothetical protein
MFGELTPNHKEDGMWRVTHLNASVNFMISTISAISPSARIGILPTSSVLSAILRLRGDCGWTTGEIVSREWRGKVDLILSGKGKAGGWMDRNEQDTVVHEIAVMFTNKRMKNGWTNRRLKSNKSSSSHLFKISFVGEDQVANGVSRSACRCFRSQSEFDSPFEEAYCLGCLNRGNTLGRNSSDEGYWSLDIPRGYDNINHFACFLIHSARYFAPKPWEKFSYHTLMSKFTQTNDHDIFTSGIWIQHLSITSSSEWIRRR